MYLSSCIVAFLVIICVSCQVQFDLELRVLLCIMSCVTRLWCGVGWVTSLSVRTDSK